MARGIPYTSSCFLQIYDMSHETQTNSTKLKMTYRSYLADISPTHIIGASSPSLIMACYTQLVPGGYCKGLVTMEVAL